MRIRHPVVQLGMLLGTALCACRQSPYDFSSTRQAIEKALPEGSSPERAAKVLDSLSFRHGALDEGDRTLTASLREPDTSKAVFSTLRVVLTFDSLRRLSHRAISEVFTGP